MRALKRILAVVLVLTMVISLMGTTAMAVDDDTNQISTIANSGQTLPAYAKECVMRS